MKNDFLGCKNSCSKRVLSIVPVGNSVLITYDDGTSTTAPKSVLSNGLSKPEESNTTLSLAELSEKIAEFTKFKAVILDNLVDIQNAHGNVTHKAFKPTFTGEITNVNSGN